MLAAGLWILRLMDNSGHFEQTIESSLYRAGESGMHTPAGSVHVRIKVVHGWI